MPMNRCHAADCCTRVSQPRHDFCLDHWERIPAEVQRVLKRARFDGDFFTYRRAAVIARLGIAVAENNPARGTLDRVAKTYDHQIGLRALITEVEAAP